MEKEVGHVRVVETDDGLRIEVKGKQLKEMFSCCCLPICCADDKHRSECCPEEKK